MGITNQIYALYPGGYHDVYVVSKLVFEGRVVLLCCVQGRKRERAREPAMEGADVAQQGQPPALPTTPKTLVDLAVDGQKQLDTVVDAAHDILLSLNRALCSPSFWVAPSLQNHAAGAEAPPEAASAGGERESGAGASEKGSDSGEGLAALDATRVRYKVATGALRATVAAIVKQTAVKAESDGGAENVDTMEADYLERRAADLREEVERKNQIVKLHVDQLRTLVADIFMWQTAGL